MSKCASSIQTAATDEKQLLGVGRRVDEILKERIERREEKKQNDSSVKLSKEKDKIE